MVIIPSTSPTRRTTLRKWPNTAAVLLRLSIRFNPRRLAISVSRPEASTRKTRDKERRSPTCVARPNRYASLVTEHDVGHAHLLEHGRPQTSAVVEQQLVEIRTPDVIAILDRQVWIIGEEECRRPFVGVGDNLGTRLVNADAPDVLGDAEAIEQGQIEGQKRFTDVESWKPLLLQHNYVLALFGEKRRDGRPGRTTTNDEHVTLAPISHCYPPTLSETKISEAVKIFHHHDLTRHVGQRSRAGGPVDMNGTSAAETFANWLAERVIPN